MCEDTEMRFSDTFIPFTDHAHGQLATYTDIPRKYYERMRVEAPELLAENVNKWLETKQERRMIRTLDGKGRAMLSSRYRRLDHIDLMESVLPALENEDIQIESCDVTDKKLYLKAVFPRLEGEVKTGDVVQSGIVVSNSEIGSGSVQVQPLVYRLACLNGMILPDSSLRRMHIGRDHFEGQDVSALLSDRTLQANDTAFWLTVHDVIKSTLNATLFKDQLDKLREAAGMPIERQVDEVVELTAKHFSLSDTMRGSVLTHLIKNGDLSKWGLANAVTATANDAETYEDATFLESVGGHIIELSPVDWRRIAAA